MKDPLMEKILNNFDGASTKTRTIDERTGKSVSSDPDTQAMYNILSKLGESTSTNSTSITESTEIGKVGDIQVTQFGMGPGKLGIQLSTFKTGYVQLSMTEVAQLARLLANWAKKGGEL